MLSNWIKKTCTSIFSTKSIPGPNLNLLSQAKGTRGTQFWHTKHAMGIEQSFFLSHPTMRLCDIYLIHSTFKCQIYLLVKKYRL